ncbi:MAG: GNAT family N-acetyltransferase [Anaerolineales bacterium]|jgi:GNAT superfamily N-acetyltransferase
MPDEITIREATAEDARAIAEVHVSAWRSSYADILPPGVLAGLSAESRAAMWEKGLLQSRGMNFLFVAENSDGEIVGFTGGGRSSEGIKGYLGEIRVLYILEAYQRMGVGTKLFRAAVARLLDKGTTSLLVWVFKDSPYRQFYEKLGGECIGEKVFEIAGGNYLAVGYGWKDSRCLVDID